MNRTRLRRQINDNSLKIKCHRHIRCRRRRRHLCVLHYFPITRYGATLYLFHGRWTTLRLSYSPNAATNGEIENSMKCKIFSHALFVDWTKSSYFSFCVFRVFFSVIGTVSLAYISLNRIILKQNHRRQCIAYTHKWCGRHTGRVRTYITTKYDPIFFHFVGHLPAFAFHFFPS